MHEIAIELPMLHMYDYDLEKLPLLGLRSEGEVRYRGQPLSLSLSLSLALVNARPDSFVGLLMSSTTLYKSFASVLAWGQANCCRVYFLRLC